MRTPKDRSASPPRAATALNCSAFTYGLIGLFPVMAATPLAANFYGLHPFVTGPFFALAGLGSAIAGTILHTTRATAAADHTAEEAP